MITKTQTVNIVLFRVFVIVFYDFLPEKNIKIIAKELKKDLPLPTRMCDKKKNGPGFNFGHTLSYNKITRQKIC